jgi:hypothetical protein
MSSTAPDLTTGASARVKGAVLDPAADALAARREADAALLLTAVDWAELHPATFPRGLCRLGRA